MRVGILGTGFGAYHASIYKNQADVESIVIFGRNEEKLQKMKQETGIQTTNRIDDILDDPGIDLVDVCLPNHLHCEYIIKALSKGKHVFCETRVCEDMDEAKAIRKAELASGKKVFVNQFIKFEPAYQLIRGAVQSHSYGQLKAIHLTRKTPAIWGALGLSALVTDLMIHELDFIHWILGAPRSISAVGSSKNANEACMSALLTYDGTMVELSGSSMLPKGYPFTVGYEAIFENGALEFHETSTSEETQQQLVQHTASGREDIELEPSNPYEMSIRHVLDCCRNNSESMISMEHAAASLRLALEIRSLVRG